MSGFYNLDKLRVSKKFEGWELKFIKFRMYKDLVYGFFKNASHMLMTNDEIHVNHKTKPPFTNYNHKQGDGNRCNKPFYLGKCSTFKFIRNI
ncbi:DUF2431 domain protein [Medicago truncatula]|uniref:DUF2431 domain protein n=1 Tax=Medicago truncatula TaxID=3880 RepID=G7IY66_MEDTR|nr:DUF2431 domain protein [Medicago truncatula]